MLCLCYLLSYLIVCIMLYDCLCAGIGCWGASAVGGYVAYCLRGWCCMLVGCFVCLICCVVVLVGCRVNCLCGC